MNEFIPIRYEQYEAFIGRLFSPGKQGKQNSRTITLQVTDACNLACTYCYQTNKNTHVMPIEIGKKFIDDLLDGKYNNYCDYSNSESVVLEFIGGEPWLCIDLIDELTDYFIQGLIDRNHPWLHRFRLSICSNGVLHFDPKVQSYIRKHNRHLSYSISIDGNKKLHDACRIFPDGSGSYDLAIAGVEDYMNTYLGRMGSKMTLAPSNISFTYEATKSLIEKGYKDINLNCVYEEGWTTEHGSILYKQLKLLADYIIENNLYQELDLSIFTQGAFGPKDPDDLKNWCGGTGAMLAVDWKGDLYPCIRYMESSLNNAVEPYIIGNVNTGILATQEQCDKCNNLNCITRRSQSTDECFNCPIADGCAWCSAYNYQMNGTPDSRCTFICIMHKARALANAYYWNKIYRIENIPKRHKIHIPEDWALELISLEEWKFLNLLAEP